jgi:hypothetical protein
MGKLENLPVMSRHGIDRTAAGLRERLFQALEELRDGKIDGKQAAATAQLAQTIIKSIEVQMVFEKQRLASELPSILPPMKLGGPDV